MCFWHTAKVAVYSRWVDGVVVAMVIRAFLFARSLGGHPPSQQLWWMCSCVFVCIRVCSCVCVCSCVRAFVRSCVCAFVRVRAFVCSCVRVFSCAFVRSWSNDDCGGGGGGGGGGQSSGQSGM